MIGKINFPTSVHHLGIPTDKTIIYLMVTSIIVHQLQLVSGVNIYPILILLLFLWNFSVKYQPSQILILLFLLLWTAVTFVNNTLIANEYAMFYGGWFFSRAGSLL